MIGASSLNTNNPMVIILEQEFESVRKLLVKYTRLYVQSMIIINICNVIFCLSALCNIPLLIFSEIVINMFMVKTLRKLHGECNLKQVGKIAFNQDYDIYNVNITDVYNSTRQLSCMKGKLENIIYIISAIDKFYIIISIISLIWMIASIIIFNTCVI